MSSGSSIYDNIVAPSKFSQAVDKAVDEINQAFLDDPQAIAAAEAEGDRWLAITNAEQAAGVHGVVLPVAVAQAVLDVLEGREPVLLSPEQVTIMLAANIKRQVG